MKAENRYFNLIEDYIDGKLSPEEMKSFRDRLATDHELHERYLIRQKLAENWDKADEYIAIKNRIADVIKSGKKSANPFKKYYIPLAATIAILLSIYAGIKINQKNHPGENFANEELIDSTSRDSSRHGNKIMLDFIEAEHKAALDSITNNGTINGTDSIVDK